MSDHDMSVIVNGSLAQFKSLVERAGVPDSVVKEWKRLRRRERNKRAAAQCRVKKVTHFDQLEQRMSALRRENDTLRAERNLLASKYLALQQQVGSLPATVPSVTPTPVAAPASQPLGLVEQLEVGNQQVDSQTMRARWLSSAPAIAPLSFSKDSANFLDCLQSSETPFKDLNTPFKDLATPFKQEILDFDLSQYQNDDSTVPIIF